MPQLLSGTTVSAPSLTLGGTVVSFRDQNHMLMPWSHVLCITYHPPRLSLKAAPNEFNSGKTVPQPWLLLTEASQFVESVDLREEEEREYSW
jgi:hypothetical protein